MLFLQLSSIALIIDYELRKLYTNYKRTSQIIITLKHRFLKKRNNVISVFYFFNKADIFLTSHFFVVIRLSLTCLDKDIYFYINAFFLYIYFLFT